MSDLRLRARRSSRSPIRTPLAALAVTVVLAIASPAQAVFVAFQLPGTATFDAWIDMTFRNFPGYGIFPGASPWPDPILPNVLGSDGNLDFDKLSGNGYPAGFSIYAPFTSSVFGIMTAVPTAVDIETVAFQVDIGPGDNFIFYDATPTLNYNGGTQALAPDFEDSNPGDYPFTNPTNPAESGTTTAFGYQW
ncbi:MAG: hypothetical protein AAGC67_21165, partial [Myxococcota bacterium]